MSSAPRVEPPRPQPVRAFGGRQHGLLTSQLALGDAVEVVAVQVRQDDGVQPRQVCGLHGGLGQALGPQSLAQVGPLSSMEEVRVRQHRERPEPDQGRGGADEHEGVRWNHEAHVPSNGLHHDGPVSTVRESCDVAGSVGAMTETWPGTAYPLGATFDGSGTNFALFSEVAERVELCLFDADPDARHVPRDQGRGHRGRRLRVALLPPDGAARPALRLPRPRPVGPEQGPALQPEQAAARPLRQGHRRRDRLGPVALRLRLRRRGLPQRRRLRGAHDPRRGHQPVLRLGGRPPPRHPLQRVVHLRGPRQGPDPAAPRRARRSSAGPTPASRTPSSPRTCRSSASPRSS